MAASAWVVYNTFKEYMADNTINLSAAGDPFRLALFRTSGAATVSLSTTSLYSELAGECSQLGNYLTGGLTLSAQTWTTGVSAGQMKFDATDWSLSASATIQKIRYAAIFLSTSAGGGPMVCWSALTTTETDLNSGSKLTIQFAGDGIFTLV